MIPDTLQQDLIKRFEKLFEGHLFLSPTGEKVPVKVYEQHFPIPTPNTNPDDEFEEEDNSSSFFPAIIVQLNEGVQENWNTSQIVKVNLVIGVWDDSTNRIGYKDVTNIIRKISIDLSRNRRMDTQYTVPVPPRWKIDDEDLHPYYFGAMFLQFEESINVMDEEVKKLI